MRDKADAEVKSNWSIFKKNTGCFQTPTVYRDKENSAIAIHICSGQCNVYSFIYTRVWVPVNTAGSMYHIMVVDVHMRLGSFGRDTQHQKHKLNSRNWGSFPSRTSDVPRRECCAYPWDRQGLLRLNFSTIEETCIHFPVTS